MENVKEKKKCLYGKRFAGSLFYCDYLCMTGKMRPCDAENCTEFIDKKNKQFIGGID